MSTIDKFRELAEKRGGAFSVLDAEAAGITRSTVSKYYSMGKLKRVVSGSYALNNDTTDPYVRIAEKSECLTFSHETALLLLGFWDRDPYQPTVTFVRAKPVTKFIRDNCRVFTVKPEEADLGRITVKTPEGSEVPCYDLERTVCDMTRSRHKLPNGDFFIMIEKLKENNPCDPVKLREYAEQLNTRQQLEQFLGRSLDDLTGGTNA